MEANLEKTDF
ncbi:hypothetical protein PSE305_14450 [Pseudomonas aeruginosa]|nr:hypothetical protein PSE305_14450 [Pseudomonas aeruginosa]